MSLSWDSSNGGMGYIFSFLTYHLPSVFTQDWWLLLWSLGEGYSVLPACSICNSAVTKCYRGERRVSNVILETRGWRDKVLGEEGYWGALSPTGQRVFILWELPGAAVSAGSGLLQKSGFHNGWFPAAPGKAGRGSLCACVCVFL